MDGPNKAAEEAWLGELVGRLPPIDSASYGGWVNVLACMAGDCTAGEWALRIGVPVEEVWRLCKLIGVQTREQQGGCGEW